MSHSPLGARFRRFTLLAVDARPYAAPLAAVDAFRLSLAGGDDSAHRSVSTSTRENETYQHTPSVTPSSIARTRPNARIPPSRRVSIAPPFPPFASRLVSSRLVSSPRTFPLHLLVRARLGVRADPSSTDTLARDRPVRREHRARPLIARRRRARRRHRPSRPFPRRRMEWHGTARNGTSLDGCEAMRAARALRRKDDAPRLDHRRRATRPSSSDDARDARGARPRRASSRIPRAGRLLPPMRGPKKRRFRSSWRVVIGRLGGLTLGSGERGGERGGERRDERRDERRRRALRDC